MLRPNDIAAAVQMAQAVAQPPRGHFDHDAASVCGPALRDNPLESVPPPAQGEQQVRVRRVVDENGEPRYLLVEGA